MTQSNISIRIDNQLKQQFDSLCNELGLSMTSALNLFVKTVVREQRIPFEIAAETDPFYSDANINRINKKIKEITEKVLQFKKSYIKMFL